MRNILFVHHSKDLYGSGKVLLSIISNIDRNKFHPYVALPEGHGPLVNALHSLGVEVAQVPLLTIERSTLSLSGILWFPFMLIRSIRSLDSAFKDKSIDIVHSNTQAVVSGAFWARKNGSKHVWHIHEMIVNPFFVRYALDIMVYALSDKIICISHAVCKLLNQTIPGCIRKSVVVWNGITSLPIIDDSMVRVIHERIQKKKGDVVVTLVGRINRWKGQQLFVEAAEKVWKAGTRNIRYLIVGSPPDGQEYYRSRLEKMIKTSIVNDYIYLMGQTESVDVIWAATDIAVIPSIEPEPFGLVAIEAMAATKPVIAARHGGLVEIVSHGSTGLLVEPGNSDDLAAAIIDLSGNERKRVDMGRTGFATQKRLFSLDAMIEKINKIYSLL